MSVSHHIRAATTSWALVCVMCFFGCKDGTAPTHAPLSIQLAPNAHGNGQSDTIGGTLTDPLRVVVLRGERPASGIAVSWSASAGSLSPTHSITDASGIARAFWTLGDSVGAQSAMAYIPSDSAVGDTVPLHVMFSALARPGTPAVLVFRPGPSNAFVGRPLIRAVQVVAVDRRGNVATDFHRSVTVTLAADPSGASLNGTTTVNAVAGVAVFTDLSLDRAGAGYTLAASAAGLPSVTSAAFEIVAPGPGRIAFVSARDGNSEIYTMNPDGSGLVNLTNNPASDDTPAWSPDGTKIAFVSFRDGNWEIYVMNADGSGLVNVTNNPTSDYRPVWSPDGAKIAFVRYGNACCIGEIYVINADGSGATNLTSDASNFVPVWSPDGSKIAFTTRRDGNDEVYLMNSDGSGLLDLTNNPGQDYAPAWSPDGSQIAFLTNRDGNWEIYLMSSDGNAQVDLTTSPAIDQGHVWSPDGKRLLYHNSGGIAIINADGTGFAQIITNAGCRSVPCVTRASHSPAWSPNGASIAVAWDSVALSRGCVRGCRRLIASGVSVLNPDGSGLVTLVETPGATTGSPAWSPR